MAPPVCCIGLSVLLVTFIKGDGAEYFLHFGLDFRIAAGVVVADNAEAELLILFVDDVACIGFHIVHCAALQVHLNVVGQVF